MHPETPTLQNSILTQCSNTNLFSLSIFFFFVLFSFGMILVSSNEGMTKKLTPAIKFAMGS